MSSASQGRMLFVGIGSPHGDDRIGWCIADSLQQSVRMDIDIRKAAIPGDLLDWLDGVRHLIVCDACFAAGDSNSDEPVMHRWDWPTAEVTGLRSANSHAFGLSQVLQLTQRLGTLPEDVTVIGIEGQCYDAFAELSPRLADAIDGVVQTITEAILREDFHDA